MNEVIERVARALFEAEIGSLYPPDDIEWSESRAAYIGPAKAAILAMREAASVNDNAALRGLDIKRVMVTEIDGVSIPETAVWRFRIDGGAPYDIHCDLRSPFIRDLCDLLSERGGAVGLHLGRA